MKPGCWPLLLLIAGVVIREVQAKIGYFWHISDLHYDINYSVDGDVRHNCRRATSSGNALGLVPGEGRGRPDGRFGDLHCDAPWPLLESAAQAMKRIATEVDFVLWTGAGPLSGHDAKVATQNVTQLLLRAFPTLFVFPVLGPDMRHAEHYKDASDVWKMWLPAEALVTFHAGGYYFIEQKTQRLRIVALNTNLWLENSGRSGREGVREREPWEHRRGREGVVGVVREPWTAREMRDNRVNEEDPAGQWLWLEQVLSRARKNKETVYLVGHTAPGADDRSANPTVAPGHGGLLDIHNTRFLNVVRHYADIIVGQFFGSRHSDTFRVVYNDSGSPVSWMLLPPSVTPRRTMGGSNNPGLRLYKYETSTGQVLDYHQYYLDLKKANKEQRADWQLEYNLTSYYQYLKGEVSAKAFHDLAESFTSPETGPQSFARYYRANAAMLYDSPQNCYPSCQRSHYCAITRLDYADYRACMDSPASALSASSASPLRAELGLRGLLLGLLLGLGGLGGPASLMLGTTSFGVS